MIDILLRSTIILLFTAVLSRLARRATASLRHLIWLSGLLAAALLPVAFMVLPELELPLLPPSPVVQSHFMGIEIPQPPLIMTGQNHDPWYETAAFWLKAHWFITLWTIGFAVVFLRFVLAVTAVRRLLRRSRNLPRPEYQDVLHDLRSRLSITRPVQLLSGIGSFTPMVWGILRPTILLPAETREWTDERRRFVLAHELAHVKRCDTLTQLLTQCVSAVYWFHPLVWLAGAQMQIEREQACDDHVLNLGINPHDYAGHLVEIARSVDPDLELSPVSMSMAHPSQLEKRVNSILNQKTNRAASARPAAVVVLGTTAALTAFLGAARLTALPAPPQAVVARMPAPQATEIPPVSSNEAVKGPSEPKMAQLPLSPTLHKWLNEDVAYIISEQERQAFLTLPTDAERERFIEQFWLRRDPTPGTPQNEFREDIYNRIAYANERFSFDSTPGWHSDRGHMYVVHGKPDEIESHPSGGIYSRPAGEGGGTVSTFPFEVWTYRYIEGVGNNVRLEFVDRNGTGEYRLTIDPNGKSIINTPSASSIPIDVSSQLSPKAGVTDVTTTIRIPYNALACSGDSVFRTCDVRVTGVIWQGSTKVLAYSFGRTEKVRAEQFNDALQRMVFEKQINLTTGVYSLDVTVQDVNSGVIGTTTQQLFIP